MTDPDTGAGVALRLAGYVEGLRRDGDLDGVPRYHLEAIDRYLALIDHYLTDKGER
jgi:hypothetical protein